MMTALWSPGYALSVAVLALPSSCDMSGSGCLLCMGESAGMTGSRVIGSIGHNPSSTQPTYQRMPDFGHDSKHTIFQNLNLSISLIIG
jgi:hypothetical protein